MSISRLAVTTLVVGALTAGFALGRVVTAMQGAAGALATPAALPSNAPERSPPRTLPVVDVDGSDFDELPRYPGAVRTGYDVRDDSAASETRVEYLALASVEGVRAFYREAFADYGWNVVDLDLAYDELTFLIARSERHGAVDIESRGGGVVEIDLEIATPWPAASPSVGPTASPPPTAAPTPRAEPRSRPTAAPTPRPARPPTTRSTPGAGDVDEPGGDVDEPDSDVDEPETDG